MCGGGLAPWQGFATQDLFCHLLSERLLRGLLHLHAGCLRRASKGGQELGRSQGRRRLPRRGGGGMSHEDNLVGRAQGALHGHVGGRGGSKGDVRDPNEALSHVVLECTVNDLAVCSGSSQQGLRVRRSGEVGDHD